MYHILALQYFREFEAVSTMLRNGTEMVTSD